MKKVLKSYQVHFGFLALFLFIIAVVNPIGDFPLNDDWCYGKSVKTLMQDGYLKLYNWGEMTLLAHVYWGYFFTSIFGFSFTVLRMATLVLGFASLIGIYELFLLVNLRKNIVLLATLVCLFNPIFLSLSFSYMTDIPFLCCVIWSVFFFIKCLKTDSWKPLLLAILFCILGYLIRQVAIVLPIVWLLTLCFKRKAVSQIIAKALTPFIVTILFMLFYTWFMKANGYMQERYNTKFHTLISAILHPNKQVVIGGIYYALQCLSYIGFLMLPVLCLGFKKSWRISKKLMVFLGASVFFYLLFRSNRMLPSLDNVWIDFGVGPTTIYDAVATFTKTPNPLAPTYLWLMVTGIGLIMSFVFIFEGFKFVTNYFKKRQVSAEIVFAIIFCLLYLTPFLIVGVYDRYLLPIFPMVIILLKKIEFNNISKIKWKIAYGLTGIFALFSVCATHDYLSWNRTRWNVLNQMTKTIPKNQIQGGVEYVTWNFFSEEKDEWWNDVIPIYTLSFSPNPKKRIISQHHYSRWLPGESNIYVLKDQSLLDAK